MQVFIGNWKIKSSRKTSTIDVTKITYYYGEIWKKLNWKFIIKTSVWVGPRLYITNRY